MFRRRVFSSASETFYEQRQIYIYRKRKRERERGEMREDKVESSFRNERSAFADGTSSL